MSGLLAWVALAGAGPDGSEGALSARGSTPAGLVRGSVAADGRIDVQVAGRDQSFPAPDRSCTGELAVDAGDLRLRWICGAAVDRFGTVHEVRIDPASFAERTRTRDPGDVWLAAQLDAALTAGDPDEARGLLAAFAGRLQYAATPEVRAALLERWLTHVARASDQRLLADDPAGAASLVLDLLQNPPVWEAERPWDYMQRVRIGPPAGNRPVPERSAYLPNTPATRSLSLRLAQTLEVGGRPAEAAELARDLARLAPDEPAPRLLLGDALWAVGEHDAAREAYAAYVNARRTLPIAARVSARLAR